MKLITALFASTLILTMASYRQADVPPVTRDTVKPKFRHFFIGIMGKDKNDNTYYNGFNIDCDVYPSLKEIKEYLIKKYSLKTVVLLSISEQTPAQHKIFWEGSDEKFPQPRPIPDTIPKPRYEYGYRPFIPINQLQPTLDTINMIMENFGIDMMGSRSKALKELFNQKMGVLLGRLVVDSIKIQGGKP